MRSVLSKTLAVAILLRGTQRCEEHQHASYTHAGMCVCMYVFMRFDVLCVCVCMYIYTGTQSCAEHQHASYTHAGMCVCMYV